MWLLLTPVALVWLLWVAAHLTGDYRDCEAVLDGKRYRYREKYSHWLPRLTPWHEYAVTLCSPFMFGRPVQYYRGPRGWPELRAHEAWHLPDWAKWNILGLPIYLALGLYCRIAKKPHPWEVRANAGEQMHHAEFADYNPLNVIGVGYNE